jgi:predicted nucleic acid-binding protein
MHKTIISDTSCFIILTNIGELDLLKKLYGQVITTTEVYSEFGEALPDWVEILEPADKDKQHILELQLDLGEASAIALALEISDCTVILDDMKARRVAERLGIDFTGTLGVIVKAKNKGIISSIKPFLDKLKNTDFRLSEDIEKEALHQAGE